MRLTRETLLPAVTAAMLLQAGAANGQEAKWSMAKPLPQPLAEISGAVVDNKWYVMGGYDFATGQPQGVVTVYDPVADTWTLKKNMLFPAHHPAAVALDGKIYVFGGFVGHPGAKTWGPIAKALMYDPGGGQLERTNANADAARLRTGGRCQRQDLRDRRRACEYSG
jgi:hypothetical protein